MPHAALKCSPRLRRDSWVEFTIKPVSKYLFCGQFTQGSDPLAQNSNHYIGCRTLVFVSLVCIHFDVADLAVLFYEAASDGTK